MLMQTLVVQTKSIMVFTIVANTDNRPFPSSCLPSLESESKCEDFVMVISSTLHLNEN